MNGRYLTIFSVVFITTTLIGAILLTRGSTDAYFLNLEYDTITVNNSSYSVNLQLDFQLRIEQSLEYERSTCRGLYEVHPSDSYGDNLTIFTQYQSTVVGCIKSSELRQAGSQLVNFSLELGLKPGIYSFVVQSGDLDWSQMLKFNATLAPYVYTIINP